MAKGTQKQKEINNKKTVTEQIDDIMNLKLIYLTRVCDTSELERNCNELYKLGYETITLTNEGQNKKLILAKRIN